MNYLQYPNILLLNWTNCKKKVPNGIEAYNCNLSQKQG